MRENTKIDNQDSNNFRPKGVRLKKIVIGIVILAVVIILTIILLRPLIYDWLSSMISENGCSIPYPE